MSRLHELKAFDPLEASDGGPGPTTPSARRFQRRKRRLLVGLAVALVGAAVVATPDSSRRADEQLAAIVTFVAEHPMARFSSEHREGPGDGSSLVSSLRNEGILHDGHWAHWTTEGPLESETIQAPEGRYGREAFPGQALGERRWVFSSAERTAGWTIAPAGEADFGGLLSLFAGPPLDAAPDRAGLGELIGALASPQRVDGNTVRAILPLSALSADPAFSDAILDGTGTVTVELTSGPGGRLDRMAWTVKARRLDLPAGSDCLPPFHHPTFNCLEHRATVIFSDWNQPVRAVVRPSPADIDSTPNIDEEALAAVETMTVVVPGRVPSDLVLVNGSADEGGDLSPGCETVHLDYRPAMVSDGNPPSNRHLTVSVFGPGCGAEAFPDPRRDDPIRTLRAGSYRGSVLAEPWGGIGFWRVLISIDDAEVVLESNLDEAELVAAMASLAPLDLDTQPVVHHRPPPPSDAEVPPPRLQNG